MIVHPYRPGTERPGSVRTTRTAPANGCSSSSPRLVRAEGAGYVEYLWQWKDDERRIVPKLSYVKGFEPWGWIIGTGIYLEDVRAQVSDITRRVIQVVADASRSSSPGLLVYMTKQSLDLERSRWRRKPRSASPRRSTGRSWRARPRASSWSCRDGSSTATARCSRCCGYEEAELAGLEWGQLFDPVPAFLETAATTPAAGAAGAGHPEGRQHVSTCWWARRRCPSGTERA